MSETTRLTISLPTELLRAVDATLVNGSQSRSAVIRRLLEEALREAEEREAEEREAVERFIRGYQEQPQTEEEYGWIRDIAGRRLAELPWE